MNLDQFVAAHTGRLLDFDGKFGAQCVDLVDFYARDVFGKPVIWANAIDWFGRDPGDYIWTRNNPNDIHQLPPRGAIMVWGGDARIGTSSLGHVAVVLEADVAGFTSFDQNWPIGAACHQVRHSWLGIVGWGVARPAAAPAPPPLPQPTTPPRPASGPLPPAPVNPPIVAPPPLSGPSEFPGGVPPVASNPPAPPTVEIPEPQPVAEAGVSTSEWKVLVGYVIQAAATGTGLLIFKAIGVHVDPSVLQIVGGLEVGLTLAGTTYIASRGIRKLGTTA